jgi:hypothetical protein
MSNEKFKMVVLLYMAFLIIEVFSIRRDIAKGSTFDLWMDIVSVVLVLTVLWLIQKGRKNPN